MKKNSKKYKFIEEMFRVINNIIDKLMNLKVNELFIFVIELIIMIIFLRLLKIPFDLIKRIGEDSFSILLYPASIIIYRVWSTLVEIFYYVFAIITFIFIYNKKYPSVRKTKVEKAEYAKVFTNLYKVIIVLVISFPLIISLLLLTFALLASLYLLFQGITYISLIIITIPLIVLNVVIINRLFKYLKRRKKKNMHIRGLVFVCVFVLILGITMFSNELLKTKFYKAELPKIDLSIKVDTLTTKIDDKMKVICIGCNKNYEIIYDNRLNDEIEIEVSYNDQFVQTLFSTDSGVINIKGRQKNGITGELKDSLLKDLKNKQIYNYNLLYQKQLTIWINENNMDNLEVIAY